MLIPVILALVWVLFQLIHQPISLSDCDRQKEKGNWLVQECPSKQERKRGRGRKRKRERERKREPSKGLISTSWCVKVLPRGVVCPRHLHRAKVQHFTDISLAKRIFP